MAHDPKCYELAEYFLPNSATERPKSELAQHIQDSVEDWLNSEAAALARRDHKEAIVTTPPAALRPPSELLPCPWCGGKADWDSKPGRTGEQFWCMCVNDECSFYAAAPLRTHARAKEAIAAWNRRVPNALPLDLDSDAVVEAVAQAIRTVARGSKVAPWDELSRLIQDDWLREARAALAKLKELSR